MIRHRPHHCNPSSLRFEGGPAQGTPVEDPRASSSVVCVTSRMNIARMGSGISSGDQSTLSALS